MYVRDAVPTAENSSNFNIVNDPQTVAGTTLENLKAAVQGETCASANYAAYSEKAKQEGFDQISRLFAATSAAEQIHIKLETAEILKKDPSYEPPTAPTATTFTTDVDLIGGAAGEIFETSDMYPTFIKKAQEEGEKGAEMVFTRAKLAEGVHAQLYLEAYNNIDSPDQDDFYLCPVCGYIHKGGDFEKCPICFTPASSFKKF